MYLPISTCGPIEASIRPPGSKSITNRALVCAALAEGASLLTGALVSEDTEVMLESLRQLGIEIEEADSGTQLKVAGCGGSFPNKKADLYVANSGTTIRFLTAAVSLAGGEYRLSGVPRMHERPIGDLIAGLNDLGASVRSETNNDCPPVLVKGRLRGGKATIAGEISSQFLSGLLMAAPGAEEQVELLVRGDLVSRPYVSMTLAVMESFGAAVHTTENLDRFSIAPATYKSANYAIEPDASAASYFWAAAAISGGRVQVEGLHRTALQGDVAFCDCLANMGCLVEETPEGIAVTGRPLRGIAANMNAISDTVQTLAAVALFAAGETTITNVGHIRHKETDRIGDLARELRKFGGEVQERSDGLTIVPPKQLQPAKIETYRDHRMAMSLALVGLKQPGVEIGDPGCVEKTYPLFFEDLAKVCS